MRALRLVAGLLVVAAPRVARADLLELKWSVEGYYRARAVELTNLAPQDSYTLVYPVNGETITIPEIRHTSYLMQRLRAVPQVRYGDLAKLTLQVDALDDVAWGD